MIELERKFLVSDPPDSLAHCRSQPIDQAYLTITDQWEFRVRRIGAETVLTIKHGSGERRTEVEVPIGEDEFQSLRSLSDTAIAKRRHYLEDGEVTIEVDVYEGELEGLIIAEVEFDSEAAAAAFAPPRWLGEEVTGDARYANQQLALIGAPDQTTRALSND